MTEELAWLIPLAIAVVALALVRASHHTCHPASPWQKDGLYWTCHGCGALRPGDRILRAKGPRS